MPQPRKLHDKYFLQAKADGYVARSAYKLLEINERLRIFRSGDTVLDLGCSPGSWLQVAADLVGPQGMVVGIDLQELSPHIRGVPGVVTPITGVGDNVVWTMGDIFKTDPKTLLALAGYDTNSPRGRAGGFDVIISDMAPNTSGHGDDLLSSRLCRRVLEILPPLLRPGGMMVMKIFEGSEYPAVLDETKALFREARGFKPHACRDISRETYIIGTSFRPPHPDDLAPRRSPHFAPAPPKPPTGWNAR